MALAPDSLRMASALHSCSRRTAVSLRQYVVCVPRYTHTWPHVRACICARSRDVSTEVTHHTRAALGCVCKKNNRHFFKRRVTCQPISPVALGRARHRRRHRRTPTHTDTHPPITVVNTRAIIKTYITTTINLPTAYLPGRDVYLITKG